jgi:hypothetical protein
MAKLLVGMRYSLNRIWLLTDQTNMYIDRFMHYTLYGLLATISQRRLKETGQIEGVCVTYDNNMIPKRNIWNLC